MRFKSRRRVIHRTGENLCEMEWPKPESFEGTPEYNYLFKVQPNDLAQMKTPGRALRDLIQSLGWQGRATNEAKMSPERVSGAVVSVQAARTGSRIRRRTCLPMGREGHRP